MNWAEIGRLLDRSRQSLHKRFDGLDPRPEPTARESWDTVVRRRDADAIAALEALRRRSTKGHEPSNDPSTSHEPAASEPRLATDRPAPPRGR